MTHLPQFTESREAIQLLAEHGFDGLAAALELLLNAVMKLERPEVLSPHRVPRSWIVRSFVALILSL